MSPVTILKDCIAEKLKEIEALRSALKIIGGETSDSVGGPQPVMPAEPSAPTTPPLESVSPAPTVRPAPYLGPRCSGCGGKMSRSAKIMRSGAYAEMWVCNDSSCNNEAYA